MKNYLISAQEVAELFGVSESMAVNEVVASD